MAELEISVLGGLVVTVEYDTEYEDGECGPPGYYVSEWRITAVNGTPQNCEWVERRLSKDDRDRIAEACAEAASEFAAYDYEDYGDYDD